MERPVVRVGVIGGGFVGTALVQLLLDPTRHAAIVDGATAPLELVGVAVRDTSKPHPGIEAALLTSDVDGPLSSGLGVLVEGAGCIEPVRSYVETALKLGVSVVTANKALIAESGTELAQLAHVNGADLFYEAAVGGAIPILRALRSSLAEAQALGYAEADPSADVEGFDAAAKVQILSTLAFGTRLSGDEVAREGITGIRAVDVEYALR